MNFDVKLLAVLHRLVATRKEAQLFCNETKGAALIIMRIRWRDFELPTRVICNKETLTPEYGEFIAEPFVKGFGHTIGNSLRRVLLSAIEGCAVTSVKIEGVAHEYSSIPNGLGDVTDLILNIKQLRLVIEGEEPVTLKVDVEKKGDITGADIQTDGKAEIINKNLVIATLSTKARFVMEMEARRGRGYVTAEENARDPQEIGLIPVASIFSPVLHVEHHVEDTRVGKITNYDRLVISIKTDGTISPEMALVEASKILRKHLNPFIQYFELGQEVAVEQKQKEEKIEEVDKDKEILVEMMDRSIETLQLSVRPSNCLAAEGIRTIKDLVIRTESELLQIRNFGKNSLDQIKERLQKLNLSLGMSVENLQSNKKN